MRDNGVFDFSDAIHIHVECFRFCFILLIQNDLERVMDSWNNHKYKTKHTLSFGSLSFLYRNPEVFGFSDMKKDVDLNILDMFENTRATENDFVIGSSNEFSKIALEP